MSLPHANRAWTGLSNTATDSLLRGAMHSRLLSYAALSVTCALLSACQDDVLAVETGETYQTMMNVWTPNEGVSIAQLSDAVTVGLTNDIRVRDGFLGGAVLEATDGSNVVVYARWRDLAAVEAIQEVIATGEAPDFLAALALASTEAHPYRVDSLTGDIDIDLDDDELTMINTWTPLEGASVDEVATALTAGIAMDTAAQPGFRAAAVFASIDGSNVRAYGHWDGPESLEAYGAVIMNGGAPTFARVFGFAESDARAYRVVALLTQP